METQAITEHEREKQRRLRERLLPEIDEFKQNSHTLLLASNSVQHEPNVSYAPYALINGAFYILVSDLAKHGQNLKQQPELSVMMIQDEAEASSIFARKRLTFQVKATPIVREDEEFAIGTGALIARFGEIAENLTCLLDFNLYRLKPTSGLYVKGFGQAFEISGEELTNVSWITGEGKGHIRSG